MGILDRFFKRGPEAPQQEAPKAPEKQPENEQEELREGLDMENEPETKEEEELRKQM